MATEVPPGCVTKLEHERLIVKYNELAKRFRDRRQEYADYMNAAYERYKAAKDTCREYRRYIDSHRIRTDSESELPSTSNTAAENRTTPHVSSSQTTEGEQELPTPVGDGYGNGSDEPEVVSTRSVKRKRGDSTKGMPPPVRVKMEPNSPDDPILLASEGYSSPVLTRLKPVRTETSDLDALVNGVNTPRKRNRLRAMSEEVTKPTTLCANTSSLSDGDLPDDYEGFLQVKQEAKDQGIDLDPAVKAGDFALQSPHQIKKVDVLHPLSSNIPTGVYKDRSLPSKKHTSKHGEQRKKIAIFSEDGEDRTSQVVAPKHEHTPKSTGSRRLDVLLEEGSPDRKPLPKRHIPETSSRQRKDPAVKKPRVSKISPLQGPTTFAHPRGLEKLPPPPCPEDEPLRSRPLGSLQLDDFKINPKHFGVDYAFADTFRGREQRRCLPGCTRPGCCGDAFRKVVEMGALQSMKSDAQVLEDFLGPDYKRSMSEHASEKQRDLLVQAHAYALANQYGKHRQAYERSNTPPGFWRTDMPSTQEHQADRARAYEMERQKVEERWREAMRGEGRWLFRDE